MAPTQEQLQKQIQEQRSQLDRLEERMKSAFNLIDEQKKLADSVYSLALSVERLTISHKSTAEQLTRLRSDVDDMRSKPGKHWDLVLTTAIGALTGYLVTMMLNH